MKKKNLIAIIFSIAFLAVAGGAYSLTMTTDELKEIKNWENDNGEMLGGTREATHLMDMYTATGTGVSIPVRTGQYRNIILSLTGSSTSALTMKFQGSIDDDAPNFNLNPNENNHWDYIEVIDLEDGTAIDGDTGVTLAADDTRLFEVNTNGLSWFSARTTAFTTGTTTLKVKLYNNE